MLYLLTALSGLASVGVVAFCGVTFTDFFAGIWSNPGSRLVSLDLLFLGISMIIFMTIESRRLGLGLFWIWIPLSVVLPGAFVFPVFLIIRERWMGK
jgi:hypothetical protein